MSFPDPTLSRRTVVGATLLAPAAAALALEPGTAHAATGTPLGRQVRFGAHAWNVPWTQEGARLEGQLLHRRAPGDPYGARRDARLTPA